MSTKDLPLWLQHHTGVVDTLTPEMIDAELKEHHNPEESFDAWYDRVGHKQHAALMGYYGSMAPGGKSMLDTIQRLSLFKHITNVVALGFVGFYLLTFASVAPGGNHIYTLFRLFPVIASMGITLSMWFLPDNSLLRLFYLVGLFVISWLGA
jgi:hypothetical protein